MRQRNPVLAIVSIFIFSVEGGSVARVIYYNCRGKHRLRTFTSKVHPKDVRIAMSLGGPSLLVPGQQIADTTYPLRDGDIA